MQKLGPGFGYVVLCVFAHDSIFRSWAHSDGRTAGYGFAATFLAIQESAGSLRRRYLFHHRHIFVHRPVHGKASNVNVDFIKPGPHVQAVVS